MIERLTVERGTYRDSVSLMLASQAAERLEGIESASAVSATPLNVELLERNGFDLSGHGGVGPADLVIAVRAVDDERLAAAMTAIEGALRGGETAGQAEAASPRSIVAAARASAANLAVISVPGEQAAYECASAVEAGLNVFCFSSGFEAAIEAQLKDRALERGLLLMGPDCGTAIIDGVGIGFANELARGPVGIVAASGTGAQAISCLLDAAGVGVSQLIGVGGRDLRAEVGGLMAKRAISMLGDDPATDCLVVVAKSPDPEIAVEIAARAADTGKPAVLAFPGGLPIETPGGVEQFDSLEAAAARATRLMRGVPVEPAEQQTPQSRPGAVRGLFCGGTLRDEALAVFAAAAGESRAPLALEHAEDDCGDRDAFIDFGSERLTRGRAHPMIDPTLRDQEIERQASDERVGVLLVDVVLGRCAHPDPAAHLAPAIERALAARSGDDLAVVVSLCGAQRDTQGLAAQEQRLREAGATVTRSNAHAARLAVRAAGIADPVPAEVRR